MPDKDSKATIQQTELEKNAKDFYTEAMRECLNLLDDIADQHHGDEVGRMCVQASRKYSEGLEGFTAQVSEYRELIRRRKKASLTSLTKLKAQGLFKNTEPRGRRLTNEEATEIRDKFSHEVDLIKGGIYTYLETSAREMYAQLEQNDAVAVDISKAQRQAINEFKAKIAEEVGNIEQGIDEFKIGKILKQDMKLMTKSEYVLYLVLQVVDFIYENLSSIFKLVQVFGVEAPSTLLGVNAVSAYEVVAGVANQLIPGIAPERKNLVNAAKSLCMHGLYNLREFISKKIINDEESAPGPAPAVPKRSSSESS